MKILNTITWSFALTAVSVLTSCQDVVNYDEGYDDSMSSHGVPSIAAIYDAEDTALENPLAEAAFEDMIMLKGENLSSVKKVIMNDVEVPLSEIYATAKAAYFPIPRQIPNEINNKLYYETVLGSTSYDFVVKVPEVQIKIGRAHV